MKSKTKSSTMLPPKELKQTTERGRVREAYRRAFLATRESLTEELKELEPLVGGGLDGW